MDVSNMRLYKNEELLSYLFDRNVYRNCLLTASYQSLSAIVEHSENYNILINVPLSQICADNLIDEDDRPSIYSIILPLVVCFQSPLRDLPSATEQYAVAIIISPDAFYTKAELEKIRRYSKLIDIELYERGICSSFIVNFTAFTAARGVSITNKSESLLGYLSNTSINGACVMSYESAISKIIEPTHFPNYETKNMWKNGSTDILIVEKVSGEGLLTIEYDGPHHSDVKQQRKDAVRDAILFQAGIPTLRIKNKNLYMPNNKFASDSLQIRVVMLVIELLIKKTIQQREKLKIMRKVISGLVQRNFDIGYDEFCYAESQSSIVEEDDIIWLSQLGGIEAEYHELYFNQNVSLPERNVEIVKLENNIYEVSASLNSQSFKMTLQCNYGHLEFWSKYLAGYDIFKNLLTEAVAFILLDWDFRQKRLKFEDHGLQFISPLNARFALQSPKERELYKQRKQIIEEERVKEVWELISEPWKNSILKKH
jgi:hypothetical protein